MPIPKDSGRPFSRNAPIASASRTSDRDDQGSATLATYYSLLALLTADGHSAVPGSARRRAVSAHRWCDRLLAAPPRPERRHGLGAVVAPYGWPGVGELVGDAPGQFPAVRRVTDQQRKPVMRWAAEPLCGVIEDLSRHAGQLVGAVCRIDDVRVAGADLDGPFLAGVFLQRPELVQQPGDLFGRDRDV